MGKLKNIALSLNVIKYEIYSKPLQISSNKSLVILSYPQYPKIGWKETVYRKIIKV